MENKDKRAPGEMKFSYGGQAVIEGVMMRGAHSMAVAVRNPQGQIVIHEQPLSARLYRGRIARTPFLRGLIGLWDAMGLGIRALMWSADVALDEEDNISFHGPIGWLTIAISLIIGVGIFFLLPTTAATGIGSALGLSTTAAEVTLDEDGNEVVLENARGNFLAYEALPIGFDALVINLIEGVVQLSILVVYIWFVGRTTDGRRIFAYHGAEHKTINAYEAGDDLLPDIVSDHPIEHPRCGTAFLLTVVFVSVFRVFVDWTAAIRAADSVACAFHSRHRRRRLRILEVHGGQPRQSLDPIHDSSQLGLAAPDHQRTQPGHDRSRDRLVQAGAVVGGVD